MSKKDLFPKLEGTELNDFTVITDVPELQIIDITVGDGEEVQKGATISAHYTGAVCATGMIFQSSHDMGRPITFGLDQVIEGWQNGVPGMKTGGKRRLIIPAEMAYGAQSPAPNIPANAALVFDIEVMRVVKF